SRMEARASSWRGSLSAALTASCSVSWCWPACTWPGAMSPGRPRCSRRRRRPCAGRTSRRACRRWRPPRCCCCWRRAGWRPPHNLPLSQARVHLAQGDAAAALAVLGPWRRQVEAQGWADERLKVLVLQALALQAQGDQDTAVHLLGDALALAAPGGFIRLFVD